MSARPFLRIFEHWLDEAPYVEWRGWVIECRRPDGTVVAVHPERGLHGTQRMAFKAALRHLAEGGCPLNTPEKQGSEPVRTLDRPFAIHALPAPNPIQE